MAQVRGKIKLIKHNIGWSFILIDPENLKAQAVEKFVRGSEAIQSIVLDVVIKAPHVSKTLNQLAYIHTCVYTVFYQFYRDQGQSIETNDDKNMVHDAIKYAVGFVTEVSDFKGEIHYKPISLAETSKESASEYIDSVIRLAAEYGMIVPEPGEFLEQHGLSEFQE